MRISITLLISGIFGSPSVSSMAFFRHMGLAYLSYSSVITKLSEFPLSILSIGKKDKPALLESSRYKLSAPRSITFKSIYM